MYSFILFTSLIDWSSNVKKKDISVNGQSEGNFIFYKEVCFEKQTLNRMKVSDDVYVGPEYLLEMGSLKIVYFKN